MVTTVTSTVLTSSGNNRKLQVNVVSDGGVVGEAINVIVVAASGTNSLRINRIIAGSSTALAFKLGFSVNASDTQSLLFGTGSHDYTTVGGVHNFVNTFKNGNLYLSTTGIVLNQLASVIIDYDLV